VCGGVTTASKELLLRLVAAAGVAADRVNTCLVLTVKKLMCTNRNPTTRQNMELLCTASACSGVMVLGAAASKGRCTVHVGTSDRG